MPSNLNPNQFPLPGMEEMSPTVDRERGSFLASQIRYRMGLRNELCKKGLPVPTNLTEDYSFDVLGGDTHPDYKEKQ